MKTLSSAQAIKSNFNKPSPQTCPYCEKICKSINSYKQHVCRCKNNPNRIQLSTKRDFKEIYRNLPQETKDKMAWSRGLTKETDSRLSERSKRVKGYKNLNYEHNIYAEYNNSQIQLWFNYIQAIEVNLNFDITYNSTYYPIISKQFKRYRNTVKTTFVHDYVASVLLNGNLSDVNTVHHIDKNIQNFDKYNLLIFETSDDHKRYHNSRYAKLIYNSETHLFSTYIDKSSS